MSARNLVVCSFYTADDYYRSHAERLRANLERLGIEHELQEIVKQPGEEWPDICRKKVPFLAGVARRHPDRRVYWIDVDCQLTDFPDLIADFSADIIGFQRGFGSPLGMGYERRSRFWEPCFFGINTTDQARRFIADAEALEARATIRATDDYFFEEAWRANAERLSFQVIPSHCVAPGSTDPADRPPFFTFGSSGNVAEYRGKVEQHERGGGRRMTVRTLRQLPGRIGRAGLRKAKALDERLPASASLRVRRAADAVGLRRMIAARQDPLTAVAGSPIGSPPARRRLIARMLTDGQAGELELVDQRFAELCAAQVPTGEETAAHEAATVWAHYARTGEGDPVDLMWWPRPFPGNFGDWLSPMVVSWASGRPVRYVSPLQPTNVPHVVAIGSIARFATATSTVIGTGVSSTEHEVDPNAHFVSVRGPLTAAFVASNGGPTIERYGDPGLLVSRLHPVERGSTNGKLALVRHTSHARAPLNLPDDVDELDLVLADPVKIRAFLDALNAYDGVVTSAMHVMIACHSYGIPCALVGFEGFEDTVHGSGMKYEDYCRGAGLDEVYRPVILGRDLATASLRDRLVEVQVSQEKLDDITDALRAGVGTAVGESRTPVR